MFGLLRQIDWQPQIQKYADKETLQKTSCLARRGKECLGLYIRCNTAKESGASLFISQRTHALSCFKEKRVMADTEC